ncbi:MAG TPA: histidine kinase [Flavitalea sp.]|nr:histidine kinase [Flavitalea sp.]
MNQRGWQVLLLFIVFFYLIRLIQDMPNLVNGYPAFVYFPVTRKLFFHRIFEILSSGSFALAGYYILLRFYPEKPFFAATLLLLVSALLFFIFFSLEKPNTRLRYFFLANVFYFIIYSVFGIVFFFIQYAAYKDVQRKELLIQNRQSELLFLRSQINPHFLFNSLNNIYALVYQGSDQALNAISGFSELMRYMLYDTTENIKFTDEMNYIKKYIQLQQLRFDYNLPVNISVSGESIEKTIPPLLLIPFIENAFKHGRYAHSGDELVISIINSERDLHFYCSNKIGRGHKDLQGGIGLGNVKRRLELLYPQSHELLITNDSDSFTIKLHLKDSRSIYD